MRSSGVHMLFLVDTEHKLSVMFFQGCPFDVMSNFFFSNKIPPCIKFLKLVFKSFKFGSEKINTGFFTFALLFEQS